MKDKNSNSSVGVMQSVDKHALPPLPDPIDIDWPELHSQALGCGVEDRNITDRYEAAEYGWQDGVDRAAECVPDQLFDSDQMRAYARAALSAGPTQAPHAQAEPVAWMNPDSCAPDEAFLWYEDKKHRVPVYATAPAPQEAEQASACPARVAEWKPIATAPRNQKEMFIVKGLDVDMKGFSYTTDPWAVWADEGNFVRWPHAFSPTHWMPLPELSTTTKGQP